MKKHLITLMLTMAGLGFAQETAPATPETPAVSDAIPQDPNAVAATYGDEELTLAEFEVEYQAYAGRLLNQQGMPASPENYKYFDAYREQILQDVVQQIVASDMANSMGFGADPAVIDAQIQQVKAGFQDDAAYQQAIKDAGIRDEAFLRELIARDIATQNWINSLSQRAEISDSALQMLYLLDKDKFNRSAQACVKHILVQTPEIAATVKDRLDKGEAFAAVAQEVSQDPGSAAQGGELGCFSKGETVPEFDKASFEGPVGQLQQVTTQFGVHLLIVDRRNEAGVLPFEDAKAELASGLKQRAAYKVMQAKLAKVPVELNEEVVRVDVPAAPEGEGTGDMTEETPPTE